MKGLVYRELYLLRKQILSNVLVYILLLLFFSLIYIITYAGNLARIEDNNLIDSLYPMGYFLVGTVPVVSSVYGNNELIAGDYRSRWMQFSYTLPFSEKKIIVSKIVVRGMLLLFGFVLSVLGEVILAAAAKKEISFSHIRTLVVISSLFSGTMFEIPLMLKFRTLGKMAAVEMVPMVVLFLSVMDLSKKIADFCTEMGAELYPLLEKTEGVRKVAMGYLGKARDAAFGISPLFIVISVSLAYFFGIKELKRRRF